MTLKDRYASRPALFQIPTLFLLVVVCFAPFINKPFHIDDSLFMWTAKQIRMHPLDFYGFQVNWGTNTSTMVENMKNPPLYSYYLAAASMLVGWSEAGMHAASFLIVFLTLLGVYFLAREFLEDYFFATLLVFASPVFQICSTNIMCDMMMTGFFIWSILFWIWAANSDKSSLYILAGLMAGLSALSKYFGLATLGIISVWDYLKYKKIRPQLLYLLIPVGIIFLYEVYTALQYKVGLIGDAMSFSMNAKYNTRAPLLNVWARNALISLIFLGGFSGILGVLAFVFGYINKSFRIYIQWAVLFFLSGALFAHSVEWRYDSTGIDWTYLLQAGLWAMNGAILVLCLISSTAKTRDPLDAVLLIWFIGTIVFAAFFNWTVAGRTFLPLVAPLVFMLCRMAARFDTPRFSGWFKALILAPTLGLSLILNYADYTLASASKEFITENEKSFDNRGVWFQGHWGFQYYAELAGARPLEKGQYELKKGDLILVPTENVGYFYIESLTTNKLSETVETVFPYGAILDDHKDAGFYSSGIGIIPFVFGRIQPKKLEIFEIEESTSARKALAGT